MKARFTIILSLSLLIGLSFLFLSSSNNPPNGRTGAPGETTCAACHSMNGGGFAGMVEISGLPNDIEAGEIYPLTVTTSYTNGTPMRAGFQITGLDGSNNAAGTLSNNSAGTTITNSGGRIYLEHNPAEMFNGNSSISWTVDWTAPNGPNGETITFYGASVIANGGNGNQMDDVVITTASGTLSVPVDPLVVEIIDEGNVTCFGDMDGFALAEAGGGQQPYAYNWSNGASGDLAENLGPGTYTVTVTDDLGTTATADVTIEEPAELLIVNEIIFDNTCPESEEGSISVEGDGGTPPYNFAWSNGETGNTIEFLTEGTYTVTLTDVNNCQTIADFDVITLFESPDFFIVGPDEICMGEFHELSTSEDFVTYDWSTGENTSSIFIDFPDLYEVTVTDENGCEGTAVIDIFELSTPVAEIVETDVDVCNGVGTVTLGSQEQGLDYLWSTGETTQFIDVMEEGFYFLTVTNTDGCSDEDGFEVEFPADFAVQANNIVNNPCFGDSEGSVLIGAVGGIEPYDLMVHDYQTGTDIPVLNGEQLTGLAAGTYALNGMDGVECQATVDFEISEPQVLLSNLSVTHETLQGAEDGTASVAPEGGTTPYGTIQWSTGETGNSIGNLAPGDYSVTITDANNCTLTESFTIQPGGCDISATAGSTDISCFEANDGSITLTIEGGTAQFTYVWTNGQTTDVPSLSDLPAGEYGVTITDASNCTFELSGIVISEPDELIVMLSLTHETLKDANDGTASVVVSGGVPPYKVDWSTGETGNSIENLSPNIYNVQVTDANGCVRNLDFVIDSSDLTDNDMDGFTSDVDCDDNNPDINPDADEIPNNDVDENCDGEILIIDEDGDGFNSDEDCDDSNPEINPDADEIPNNDVDENCDGEILIIDEDGDGFNSDEDCDDSNPDINPDAEEIPDNGIDEDCDGEDGTTSTDLVLGKSIELYPNPASDEAILNIQSSGVFDVSIFGPAGERYKSRWDGSRLDLRGLTPGIYIVKITDMNKGEQVSKSLIVLE